MKTRLLAVLLVVGLGVSAAMAAVYMDFPAIKDAGITTQGEHTNRGGDSQISFCNGTGNSGEFGIFDFDRAAVRNFITANLGGRTLQNALDGSMIVVDFSVVASGNVSPNAQVGVMSVYTDDNWVEGNGASGPGVTTAYNWPGAFAGTAACTAASPNDSVGGSYNWHRTDTNASGQQLGSISGVQNSFPLTGWTLNTRTTVQLDDDLWCGYIFGVDNIDVTIPVPASTMLKTYGLGFNSSMTCYMKEAAPGYGAMLSVELVYPTIERPHLGDVNADGMVDVIDLGILAKNYGSTGLTPIGYSGSWEKGDFNGDGAVDVIDLGILAKNYDWSGAPAGAVPEPACLMALALAAGFLRRGRAAKLACSPGRGTIAPEDKARDGHPRDAAR